MVNSDTSLIFHKSLMRQGTSWTFLMLMWVIPPVIWHHQKIQNQSFHYNSPYFSFHFQDYVPENLESVSEFEPPPSPDSSYSRPFPADEDFAKEPPAVPPQLHITVLGSEEATTKPQHVVLNHLFIEKGWASQSLVALGLTHRFQSKYTTVVLYKPMKR